MKAELLVECPICEEQKAHLEGGKLHQMGDNVIDILVYKCECGIAEPVEPDDIQLILYQLLDVNNDTELLQKIVKLLSGVME